MTRAQKGLTCFGLTGFAVCLVALSIAGCKGAPKTDQQLQQQAAKTTEQAKTKAQQAAAAAKSAAANAESKVNAITAGVKQGLNNTSAPGNVSANSVDINSASEARLVTLPGITASLARRIIDNRPYPSTHDLVSKGALTQAQYDRISAHIVARSD